MFNIKCKPLKLFDFGGFTFFYDNCETYKNISLLIEENGMSK